MQPHPQVDHARCPSNSPCSPAGLGAIRPWSGTGGAGLLIDVGLGPRELAARLASVGSGWERPGRGPPDAHPRRPRQGRHAPRGWPGRRSASTATTATAPPWPATRGSSALERAGLARYFDDRPFLTPGGMRVEPTTLRHDGGPTFGFRVEARADARKGRPVTVGYMADTGCWSDAMADALADVDVLGVEFNHDVRCSSARAGLRT